VLQKPNLNINLKFVEKVQNLFQDEAVDESIDQQLIPSSTDRSVAKKNQQLLKGVFLKRKKDPPAAEKQDKILILNSARIKPILNQPI